jgi:TPR repeat protein
MLADAAGGDAAAQYNLGVILHRTPDPAGQAAGHNREEAIAWLLKSAMQGLPRAHGKLAEVYAAEAQRPGDDVRACTWFLVAVDSESGIHRRNAEIGYDRLTRTLRPGQLRLAQREARRLIRILREPAAPDVEEADGK